MRKFNSGFTLAELMITVAIVGILTSLAIPAYTGYIDSSCINTAELNVETLVGFEEAYRVENLTYVEGTRTVDGNGNETGNTLSGPLHWNPNDKNFYNYTVTAGPLGIADSIIVTATSDSCSKAITTSATNG